MFEPLIIDICILQNFKLIISSQIQLNRAAELLFRTLQNSLKIIDFPKENSFLILE